jgi:phage regulator Rha-like protein
VEFQNFFLLIRQQKKELRDFRLWQDSLKVKGQNSKVKMFDSGQPACCIAGTE